jgi:ubiquinone biosynthesis protein
VFIGSKGRLVYYTIPGAGHRLIEGVCPAPKDAMLPLVRQARYLGRYREIALVLSRHGFGFLVEQTGLAGALSLPRRALRRPAPDRLTGPEHLRLALTELGPTFVKLGQVLSTRPDLLPADYVAELNKLQDTVPPFAYEAAAAIIAQELGRPVEALFAAFCREPLAAASLGQVHAATLPGGAQVVVKVQRPDIQRTISLDLAIIAELAALAQERLEIAQRYDLNELAWEFDATLRGELDYRREGRNAERFRRNFADSRIVHIPTIHWDYTGARVLTSERLFGVKINDIAGLEAAGLDRRRVARHSTELILHEIFRDGFFHADPHPGNFFVLPGDVIGAVDFGQVVALDRDTTDDMMRLLGALTRNDPDGALRALRALGCLSDRDLTPALRRDMARFLDNFVDRSLAEISAREMIDSLVALVQRHKLRMPAPLAQLLKAIVMMEGIGIQLDPQLDIFAIARPYATEALAGQYSPEALARRGLEQAREWGEIGAALPQRLNTVLRKLEDGDLRVQTRDLETKRLAHAIGVASSRVALALATLAYLLVLGLLAVAYALGWRGPAPLALIVLAALSALVSSAVLTFSILFRGRD